MGGNTHNGDVNDKKDSSFIVRRKDNHVVFESSDKKFRAIFTLNDPQEKFWPFVEVRDTKSVTVRILREPQTQHNPLYWESVSPNARVDDDVLNNNDSGELGHFFANDLNAGYELKLNDDYTGWTCFGYMDEELRKKVEASPHTAFFKHGMVACTDNTYYNPYGAIDR